MRGRERERRRGTRRKKGRGESSAGPGSNAGREGTATLSSLLSQRGSDHWR